MASVCVLLERTLSLKDNVARKTVLHGEAELRLVKTVFLGLLQSNTNVSYSTRDYLL